VLLPTLRECRPSKKISQIKAGAQSAVARQLQPAEA
jgi:hypothetical protein